MGEAPGYQEAKEGHPFIGPSGRLLDLVLAHHNIGRSAVYVDNVVACRPPGNETPTPTVVRACTPRLHSELRARPLETVVTLGNTAAHSILGTKEGITTLRVGPPKEDPSWPGVKIVSTVHPAYCLRTADAFPHFVTDIGKVNGQVNIRWEPPEYKVFDDASAALALDELGRRYNTIVVDVEVGIDKDSSFDHPERYQFLCVGLSYAPGKSIVIGEQALRLPRVRDALRRLLNRTRWVAHNGKFDLAALRQFGEPALHFDTMLASYVMDERPGVHSLGYLGVEFLGAPDWKSEISKYVGKGDSYAVVPRDVLYRYNAWDAAVTFMLYEHFQSVFTTEQRGLHDFLVQVSEALLPAEMKGLTVDIAYLDYLTDHYLDGLGVLEGKLKPWVDNPRSPKQVKEALLELGKPVQSTNKETLRALLDKAPQGELNDFLTLMLDHRREQKLYGTYVKGTRKRLYKNRVHPTFLLHGSTTGRTACRNPNLQNVPRESAIRRLFVPEDGNVYIQADYATIELRVLATEAREPFLRDLFLDGRDIHDEFSQRIYGDGFTKEQRVRTKAFVYGSAYGREPFSIAKEYKMSLHDAQTMYDAFMGTIPEVQKFREGVRLQILQEQKDLVTHFGRHRRFWLITEDNKVDVVKEGLAFIPQSTASDINLHSFVRLHKLGLDLRLPVHDSIMVECAREDATEVGRLMQEVMQQTAADVYSDYVPFPVDVEIGHSWGDLAKEKFWRADNEEEE